MTCYIDPLCVCVWQGGDDLRQDAVMQQVFGLVNTLLDRVPDTAQRDLHVRMYKVCGLLQEWCETRVLCVCYRWSLSHRGAVSLSGVRHECYVCITGGPSLTEERSP